MTERHFSDDARPIQVEISAAPANTQYDSDTGNLRGFGHVEDKIKELSDDALFEAFRTIYKVARKTELLISDLRTDDTPQGLASAQVEFGIKFSSGVDAIITSGVDATIKVRLRWADHDPHSE